jgi:hypothetical protein
MPASLSLRSSNDSIDHSSHKLLVHSPTLEHTRSMLSSPTIMQRPDPESEEGAIEETDDEIVEEIGTTNPLPNLERRGSGSSVFKLPGAVPPEMSTLPANDGSESSEDIVEECGMSTPTVEHPLLPIPVPLPVVFPTKRTKSSLSLDSSSNILFISKNRRDGSRTVSAGADKRQSEKLLPEKLAKSPGAKSPGSAGVKRPDLLHLPPQAEPVLIDSVVKKVCLSGLIFLRLH